MEITDETAAIAIQNDLENARYSVAEIVAKETSQKIPAAVHHFHL